MIVTLCMRGSFLEQKISYHLHIPSLKEALLVFFIFSLFFLSRKISFALKSENSNLEDRVGGQPRTATPNFIKGFFTLKAAITPHTLQLSELRSQPEKNDVLITFTVSDLILGRVYYSTSSPVIVDNAPWVSPSRYTSEIVSYKQYTFMLTTIAIVLIILWLIGFIAFPVLSGFIHLLLIFAIIIFIIRVSRGENALY